jgi:UDP-3-O-[3-hydroxymyristoyl] N-acetylglucosamine deacetylase / 3-hydroxyacyl-[acyl-carrier-protein] dehydratase
MRGDSTSGSTNDKGKTGSALRDSVPAANDLPLAKEAGGLFNGLVVQQQTLNSPASYSGIGLHSGNRVMMTFLPAPPNTGIRFRRVDLEGKPEIEARVENVVENNRSTTLAKGNTRIHTVEHVLATFTGYGIDNAIVELDANEPPIADGSAREYCRMIQSAGIVPQDERREPYTVTAPIQLEMGETVMTLFPDEAFKISCTSADKGGRFTQFYSLELSPTTWERDLAHARTFCFYEEIEFLIKNGLIKGGSLENAVVIRDDAVLTTEPLRYPDEFVRHKILDIVGDLSLLGRPLRGHLIAVKPGHATNCELVRRILAQMRKPLVAAQAFAPPPGSVKAAPLPETSSDELKAQNGAMDIQGVMQLLPHRYPFLMVDRVAKLEGNHIVGIKNVTVNESYFQGHFPGHPVMPGVLQLEAIAQVAGIVMLKSAEDANKLAYFMSAEDVKWRKPVLPGDVLVIDVELTKMRGKIGKAKGVCKVGGEVVSEAAVTFMLIEP